ncbi:hypothetical protein RFI_40258, partial [Reticulomyxa filosa]
QAVFEEFVAEQLWHWYEIKCKENHTFANDMVCAIQQTLNVTMNANVNVNVNDKPFVFGKTKTTSDVALDYWCGVKVNMDRIGRVCWYKVERNGKEDVRFFPGVFECDMLYLWKTVNVVDHLERLLQQNKEQYSPHVISNTTKALTDFRKYLRTIQQGHLTSMYPWQFQSSNAINDGAFIRFDSTSNYFMSLHKYPLKQQRQIFLDRVRAQLH